MFVSNEFSYLFRTIIIPTAFIKFQNYLKLDIWTAPYQSAHLAKKGGVIFMSEIFFLIKQLLISIEIVIYNSKFFFKFVI